MAIPGKKSATPVISKRDAVWQTATVRQIIPETAMAKTFWLDLPQRQPFYAGQHLEVRLTSPDGYQAARSYSIASSPLESGLAISVLMIPDGEVSGYLDSLVQVGDKLEVHYPIGYHFIWDETLIDPVLLIGGGSGVVPLAAMHRHHLLSKSTAPMRLLYSVRKLDDVFYKQALLQDQNVTITVTDEAPKNWQGLNRRIDAAMLETTTGNFSRNRLRVYICGPTPMVEAVSSLCLKSLGLLANQIKTERFGPTGPGR